MESYELIKFHIQGVFFEIDKKLIDQHEDTALEAMTSGRHYLPMIDGAIDIQGRNPELFGFLIHYLKFGQLPKFDPLMDQDLVKDEFLFWTIPYQPFDSDIILEDEHVWFVIQKLINYRKMKLLYSIGRDSLSSKHNKVFHQKCDGIHNTITFIEADTGAIFGGFASEPWQSKPKGYGYDKDAKIFNVGKQTIFNVHNPDKALYFDKDLMPCFGCDIFIVEDCRIRNVNYSQFGQSYELPEGLVFRSDEAKTYFTGFRQ